MATYQKIVEARQYSGPTLKVVNDSLGELTASDGDYLVGTERGKISVVPKAEFEADYSLHISDESVKQVADLTQMLADVKAAGDAKAKLLSEALAESAALKAAKEL